MLFPTEIFISQTRLNYLLLGLFIILILHLLLPLQCYYYHYHIIIINTIRYYLYGYYCHYFHHYCFTSISNIITSISFLKRPAIFSLIFLICFSFFF